MNTKTLLFGAALLLALGVSFILAQDDNGILTRIPSSSSNVNTNIGAFYGVDVSNPNNNVTAQQPAIFYNNLGAIWVKTNLTLDNVGWDCNITNRN